MNSTPAGARGLTTTQWLVCIIAAIGFAFDIYELLMLPLIIGPAIKALSGGAVQELVQGGMSLADATASFNPGGPNYLHWARTLFFLPAMVGGVFGLLGGYLTDLLGRRRVLTFSILLYAFAAFGSGYVTNLSQLLILRCLVFIGVCVEFVAAVAWLAELFHEPKERESVLGYTQAFSSVGGLMVGGVYVIIAEHLANSLPAIHGGHEAWRYMLMSGIIPALPLIVIRPFLPESPIWSQKKAAGTLQRPSIAALFSPELCKTTILTTLVFASSYGFAFGAIQQLPQVLRGPKGHAAILATAQAAEEKVKADAQAAGKPAPSPVQLKIAGANATQGAISRVSLYQEVGGLIGRFALAILAARILSRRLLMRIFQIPAVIIVPALFLWISKSLTNPDSLTMIKLGIGLAGFFVVAQFSFWGNYIPRVFPVHLRGTGESFAANIGGRIIGTAAAWFTLTFAASVPPSPAKIAVVAACVAGIYGLIGVVLTQWLPEPSEQDE
ncbi:MFS transporter [bacterium]|nr:MFS transporter [bacterium]